MLKEIFKAAAVAALCIFSAFGSQAQGLPPLTFTNIGSFLVRSQTSITNNDPGVFSSYSIVGGGNELWGSVDKGTFGYFITNGNFDVRVRVESLEQVHRYAKTGLMVREGLTATSRMISLFATPTGPTELPTNEPVGENEVEFNFRRAAGDGENNINLGPPGYPDAWLRLARRGPVFYGLVSRDGINWTTNSMVDTASWPAGAFKNPVYLGLGSSSHVDTRLVRSELRQFSPVSASGQVQILQPPVDLVGLDQSTVAFSVRLNNPVDARYQWFANNVQIPDATNATYQTPTLSLTDNNTRYKVTITPPTGQSFTSSDAVLSVVSITAPEFPDLLFDFDDGEVPLEARIFGSAIVDPSEGFGGGGGLLLTTSQNSQNGSFVVDDFTGGQVVDGFTVAFKLKIGPGSAKPADGFSFSFGTNIPNGVFPAPQQGVGPGLAISFDLYDNGGSEAPAIDVFYGVDPSITPLNLKGNILHRKVALADLLVSRYVDVIVRVNSEGRLDLVYDGEIIAYQLQTPFVPLTGGRFGFGAVTGGQNALHVVDDILISTSIKTTEAYLGSFSPLGNNVAATPEIRVELVDLTTVVVTNSIQLRFNGTLVPARISQNEELRTTTVAYTVPNLLPALSTNVVSIVWNDDAGNRHTNSATFRVGGYITLPSISATTPGSGTVNNSGFRIGIYQVQTNLTPTALFAEGVLLGEKGANIADLTLTDETGYFSDPMLTSVINFDVNAGSSGLLFPGIPGITESKENFAGEILSFIEFPSAGFYQMGIRSDDGFVLTAGDPNNLVQVAAFDGEREPADTIFGFVVPKAGLYPFRLVYYQRSGGASLRWFSVTTEGQQVLINAPEEPTAILAYRSITTTAVPRLNFVRTLSGLQFTWTGSAVLETSTAVNGPWVTVNGAVNSYGTTFGDSARFFRLRL